MAEQWEDMTKDELMEEARTRGVAGRSSMTKDELIEALGDSSIPPRTADGEISNPPVVPNQSAQDDT